TSCYRDWSSDVCSSDLLFSSTATSLMRLARRISCPLEGSRPLGKYGGGEPQRSGRTGRRWAARVRTTWEILLRRDSERDRSIDRSEERRVGKDGTLGVR